MVPRCTTNLEPILVGIESDVHQGYDLGVDPWPFGLPETPSPPTNREEFLTFVTQLKRGGTEAGALRRRRRAVALWQTREWACCCSELRGEFPSSLLLLFLGVAV